MRLAILTGRDSSATCSIISTLARLPEVQVIGILVDSGRVPLRTRLRRLRRHMRRDGWSYLGWRLGSMAVELQERLAAGVVSQREVSALIATAFPGQAHTLDQLGKLHGIPIFALDNLNGARAVEVLRGLAPDLGVVLGTRILKRSTFSVPRMGCVNLHLGKVPEYRGMPPGFWELYDGQPTAGVTVHLVDDGIDTGDVVGEEIVHIHDDDTPWTLNQRLEAQGRELLARCVTDFAQERVTQRPQPSGRWRTRTSPTRREQHELERRLGTVRRRQGPWIQGAKTLGYLLLYYSGLVHLVRAARSVAGTSRACVLLYHRVNDLGDDPLTTRLQRFAEHMLVLRRYYAVLPSSLVIEKLETGRPFPGNTVAIHFDDSYRDVFTYAKPVLAALDFPASMLVPSGYVGTERRYPQDDSSPWTHENLRAEDLCALATAGFEIGSHTVSHVDLALCTDDTVSAELSQSKRDLEAMVGRPVTLFALPFGQETNFRPGVKELVRHTGYRAMFSAYGGYITGTSSLFDLPRVDAGTARPLDLLMEVEGLSLGAIRRRWRRRPRRELSRQLSTVGDVKSQL